MVSLSHMPPKKGKTKFDYVHSSLVSSHLLVTLKFFFTVYQRMMVSAYIYILMHIYIYIIYIFFVAKIPHSYQKTKTPFLS